MEPRRRRRWSRRQLLEGVGFTWRPSHAVYLNSYLKKVISSTFAEQRSRGELEKAVRENDREWRFYADPPLTPGERSRILGDADAA